MGKPVQNRTGTSWLMPVLFALAYFLSAAGEDLLAGGSGDFIDFCLPIGLYIGVLLLIPTRLWPWFILAALPASLAYDIGLKHHQLGWSLLYHGYNSLEAVLAAWSVRRWIAYRPRLESAIEVLGFTLICVLAVPALTSALIAAVSITFGNGAEFWTIWRRWWTGDAVGIVVVTPLILTWSGLFRRPLHSPSLLRWGEGVIAFGFMTAWAWIVIHKGGHEILGLEFLILPCLVWIAWHFGAAGVSVSTLILAVVSAWHGANLSEHPESMLGSNAEDAVVIQLFLTATSLSGLLIAGFFSERKSLADRLEQSLNRYRHLFEAVNDPLLAHYADNGMWSGRLQAVNEAACRELGFSRAELLARSISELVPSEKAAGLDAAASQLGAERRVVFETELEGQNGERYPVEISSQIFAMEGRDTVLSVVRNLTERRRREQQRREQRKLEAIKQLAGGIAHEFNNNLTAMNMQVSLLEAECNPESSDTARLLRGLSDGVNRAAALTRQLVMFSRQSVMQLAPVDLNDVMLNMRAVLQRITGRSIRLIFDLSKNLPSVQADIGLIEQCVMNLCLNSKEAMPEGGELRIGTRPVEFAANDLPAHPDRRLGRFVELSVTDSGRGMSEETVARLFEPFFTTKDVGQGTGMGLPAVYGVVKQHWGWIEVSSRPGAGASFRILLPELSEARSEDTGEAGL